MLTIEKTQPSKVFRLLLVPVEHITPEVAIAPSPLGKNRILITTCVAEYATREDLATLTAEDRMVTGTLRSEECPGSGKPSILSDSWENGV